ncbi:uncharacterized protein J3D65DRAFT_633840 [Phyllosticta citribraziliensis]|uniref:F-box domain-containing protein n=1 Tax=Phyllosticta citribraziliensis TaxID=989973 RepID=A0ABR1LCH6_9PEZI
MLVTATGLSVEIWSMIVEYVLRPTDLRNLCLVCKQLHQIAVRSLYRDVILDVGSTADLNLGAFLNPRNVGLQHIRRLHIYLADIQDKRNQLQQAHFAVRMILEFLPENILERFSWHPWQPFSAENLLLLYRRQQRMTFLEGISLDKNILDQLEGSKDLDHIAENVRALGLYPDSRDVLDFCNILIRKNSRVDKLVINASFNPTDSLYSAREFHDSSTGPGLIATKLFGHMSPFEECKPWPLAELTLQKIHLRYSAETYCRVIDFSALRKLALSDCPGACTLFAELSKSNRLPSHLDTLEFKHTDNAESDALHALDNFLCLVTGLKHIRIDITNVAELPAAEGIIRHGKTLKQLIVHANGPDPKEEEHVYSVPEFERICADCPYLEQISVGFPATSIVSGKSESYAAFETALSNLPNLITLNVTTWPKNTNGSSALPRPIYAILLNNAAQSLLSSHKPLAALDPSEPHSRSTPRVRVPSRLNLIAFGPTDALHASTPCSPLSASTNSSPFAHGTPASLSSSPDDDADDRRRSLWQVVFVKGTQVGPFGEQAPLAVRVKGRLRRYVEPRSDVLDFGLARAKKMPGGEAGAARNTLPTTGVTVNF